MESLLCYLVEESLPVELRPLNQLRLKVQGQEAKLLLVDHSYRHYSERTRSHFHLLIPGPVNPRDGRNSTIRWMQF